MTHRTHLEDGGGPLSRSMRSWLSRADLSSMRPGALSDGRSCETAGEVGCQTRAYAVGWLSMQHNG